MAEDLVFSGAGRRRKSPCVDRTDEVLDGTAKDLVHPVTVFAGSTKAVLLMSTGLPLSAKALLPSAQDLLLVPREMGLSLDPLYP